MTKYVATGLTRESSFHYRCEHCTLCCYQQVRVNPYEIARLAENRGISTSDCISEFIDKEQQSLRRKTDGGCVFLEGTECKVHPDRPLSCRLYPLGRFQTLRGEESFVELEAVEGSKGVYGEASGSIEEFLQNQEAEVYLRFTREYVQVFRELLGLLIQCSESAVDFSRAVEKSDFDTRTGKESEQFRKMNRIVLDIDYALREFGDGMPETNAELRTEKHLVILRNLERGK